MWFVLLLLACDTEVTLKPTDPVDSDGDGYTEEVDCDDRLRAVHPEAPELCDGIDNDCDQAVDEDPTDAASYWVDGDDDGWGAGDPLAACDPPAGAVEVPGDCDDEDALVSPDAPELCNERDDDCDGAVDEDVADAPTWYADADGDRWGDADEAVIRCTAPAGTVERVGDCDDLQPLIFPGGQEVCNSDDDDCDGAVDEGASDARTWYLDQDGDSYGAQAVVQCIPPVRGVLLGGDCDDAAPAIFPGAPESCNALDDDCDGGIDEGFVTGQLGWADGDGDGWGDPNRPLTGCAALTGAAQAGDCDDRAARVHPGADEQCNGVDDDCDTLVDGDDADVAPIGGGWRDADRDGFGDPNRPLDACDTSGSRADNDDDCNDTLSVVNPNAAEVCNQRDDDCDRLVDAADPDLPDGAPTWADDDGDGFGDPTTLLSGCDAGGVGNDDDCDDGRFEVRPGATETCNQQDDDCDGLIDTDDPGLIGSGGGFRDGDGDGWGDPVRPLGLCDAGGVPNADDCDDTQRAIAPGAPEVCNLVDDDCDLLVDADDPGVTGTGGGWADTDGDGYGFAGAPFHVCQQGGVRNDDDCDDTQRAVSPAAPELCNLRDDDCDLLVDADDPSVTVDGGGWADLDDDGYGDPAAPLGACTPGGVDNADDCDDGASAVFPGAADDRCAGVDRGCDGQAELNQPPTLRLIAPDDGAALPPNAPVALVAVVEDDEPVEGWTVAFAAGPWADEGTADAAGEAAATWPGGRALGPQSARAVVVDSCGRSAVATVDVCEPPDVDGPGELPAGWSLHGTATEDRASGWFRLTEAALWQKGGVYAPYTVPSDAVVVTFEVWLGASDSGADGVALVALDAGATSDRLGSDGGELGYQGGAHGPALPGWAVELDTHPNPADPWSADLTAIHLEGSSTTASWAPVPELEDGQWHAVRVEVQGTLVTVELDGASLLVATVPALRAFEATIGFTAATGLFGNEQRVREIRVSDLRTCEGYVEGP